MNNNRQSPTSTSLLFFLLTLGLHSRLRSCVHAQSFRDVSFESGLRRPYGPRLKYGGAAVADLNADGWPDLLLGHHDDRWFDIYLSQRNGKFKRVKFDLWRDTHALTPFRFSALHTRMHIMVSRGGANGNKLSFPDVLRVRHDNTVTDISNNVGLGRVSHRGRSALFINLRPWQHQFSDVLLTSATIDGVKNHQVAFHAGTGSKFRKATIKGGIQSHINAYGMMTDVNGDGQMEVVLMQDFAMWKVVAFNHMTRINVLPSGLESSAVSAIAELDYDADGRWDLFVARSTVGELHWVSVKNTNDYLLRNVGGRYVEVGKAAGIPQGLQTRGVTAGDFDNDGWIDLVLAIWNGPYIFLRNKGDGTFERRTLGFGRRGVARGDMVTAVDYNRDGRLDLVVSEGDWFDKKFGGHYRLMRNVMQRRPQRRYLLVRVGAAPGFRATSLHAQVLVRIGRRTLRRRVGSPGTAVSNSYIELTHFGLGSASSAAWVVVQWTNGDSRRLRNVRANRMVTIGLV